MFADIQDHRRQLHLEDEQPWRASVIAQTNRYQVVVSSGATQTLTYDPNGNLVTRSGGEVTTSYEWDVQNRLTAISSGTHRTEFTYDGLSRRVRIVEKDNGAVTSDKRSLWDGQAIAEERDSAGATVTKRYFAQGVQIRSANYYYSRDHLGSIREVTDGTGTIQACYDYDPYGRRTKVSGDLDSDFGFTGHYYHAPSGLHLTLYRAYDADLGRWLSRDPSGEQSGLNLYAYVGNNTPNSIDPDGLGVWHIYSAPNAGHLLPTIRLGFKLFPTPDIHAGYEMDANETKCCNKLQIERDASQDSVPGSLGGKDDIGDSSEGTAWAPVDNPGYNRRFTLGLVSGLSNWAPCIIFFRWTARCTEGPWAGKILSTHYLGIKIQGQDVEVAGPGKTVYEPVKWPK